MATAAFKLSKCTGASAASETDSVKHPCFLNADLHSTDTGSYRVAAPDPVAGTNYSFENFLRLECTGAPNNQVVNIKFWGPSVQPDSGDTPGNKMTVMAGTTGAGATPTDSASTVATTSQHDNYNAPDPGSHLAIGVVPGDSKIDAVGEKSNYLVLQLKVVNGAQRGDIATLPLHLTYDES